MTPLNAISPPKRICHVQVLPLLTGVQRAMLAMFDRLDPRLYRLHVACQGPGPLSDELARRGVACHYLTALDRPLRPWQDATAYRQLRRLFRREAFDLVHTHSSKAGFLGRLAAHYAGVPHIVHHVHGFAFHQASSRWATLGFSALERWAAGYCDRVLFVNHEERQAAIQHGIVSAEKSQTIYNGVALDEFSPAVHGASRRAFREQRQIAADEVVILAAGRLDHQKQPLILPAIAARLEALAGGLPWKILVAGAGPLEDPLRAQIARYGVQHRCQLLGWLDCPQQAFHGADVVLHPTLWEGLPLTLLEAQASGLPTVASRICGNREVVAEPTGFLCEPHDPAGYAWALARLVRDAALRRSMGRAARQRAEQLFDARQTYRQVAALYEQLLGAPQALTPALRRAA